MNQNTIMMMKQQMQEMMNKIHSQSVQLIPLIEQGMTNINNNVLISIEKLISNGVKEVLLDGYINNSIPMNYDIYSYPLDPNKVLTTLQSYRLIPTDIIFLLSNHPAGNSILNDAIRGARKFIDDFIKNMLTTGGNNMNYMSNGMPNMGNMGMPNNMMYMQNNMQPMYNNSFNAVQPDTRGMSNRYGSVTSNPVVAPTISARDTTIANNRYNITPNSTLTTPPIEIIKEPKKVLKNWLTAYGVTVTPDGDAKGEEDEEEFIKVPNDDAIIPLKKDDIVNYYLFGKDDEFKPNTYSDFCLNLSGKAIIYSKEDVRHKFLRTETTYMNLVLYKELKITIDNIITDYDDLMDELKKVESIRLREKLMNKAEYMYKVANDAMNRMKVTVSDKIPNVREYVTDMSNIITVLYSDRVYDAIKLVSESIGKDIGNLGLYSYRSLFNVVDAQFSLNEDLFLQLLVLSKDNYARLLFNRVNDELFQFIIMDIK